MKKLKNLLALTALCAIPTAYAGVAVVVHPSAAFDSLSDSEVSRIFLGKTKQFPSGEQAVPLNQDGDKSIRESFRDKVLKKTASQYDAYWAKLTFTGKGTPPKDSGDDAEIKNLVSKNPNLIGYIDTSAVDGSVKVVFTID